MYDKTLIQAGIDYIEESLNNDISLANISKHVGYSPYHFHRLFKKYCGLNLKEYIRKRRLAEAAASLLQNKTKIIDIALDSQFHTHESFSKAFKNQYGYSPSYLRQNISYIPYFGRVDLTKKSFINTLNEWRPDPKAVSSGTLQFIGIDLGLFMKNNDFFYQKKKLYPQVYRNDMLKNIPNVINPRRFYQLSVKIKTDPPNTFKTIIARRVSSLTLIPEPYTGISISGTKYISYEANGTASNVEDRWVDLYEWLSQSGSDYFSEKNVISFGIFDNYWIDIIGRNHLQYDFRQINPYRWKEIRPYLSKELKLKMQIFCSCQDFDIKFLDPT